MTPFQSLVLGAVQGFGEFLPISSSAHLIIVPWLFKWKDPGLAFDVALHLGTLVAVLTYFARDWTRLIRAFVLTISQRRIGADVERRMVFYVLIASVPGAIIGYLLEEQAETVFRSALLIAVATMAMGVILYLVDRLSSKRKSFSDMSFVDSLVIGLSQATAIIPGVSRSGITISAALFMGLEREAAARFSFLLSTPIIAGAGLVKIKYMFLSGFDPNLIIGVGSASLIGFLSIKYLLAYVRNGDYRIFVYYRFLFGIVILLADLLRK